MRRAGRPPRLTMAQFEKLVEEALEELPKQFKDRLENVVIAVEEEPTEDDCVLTDTPDDEELFGIYRGPMRTEMTWSDLPGLPSEIAIFRGPILRCTRNEPGGGERDQGHRRPRAGALLRPRRRGDAVLRVRPGTPTRTGAIRFPLHAWGRDL